MKIAFLGEATSRHVERWCRWAARRGHQVLLFSDAPPRPDTDYSGVRIIRAEWSLLQKIVTFKLRGGTYANNRDKWKAYAPLILREAPDLLHAFEASCYGPMLPHFPGFPRVLNPWGRDVECISWPDPGRRAELSLAAMRAADVITTNAPGLEHRWARYAGIPADRFFLFPWGVDTETFYPRSDEEKEEILAKLGLPRDRPILLSPRLAEPYYGIAELMEGFHHAAIPADSEKGPLLAILRAGANADDWQNWRELRDKQKSDSIRLIDVYLAPHEMAALYSAAAGVAMLPETDLLASSLLESLACGSIPLLAEQSTYRHAVAGIGENGISKAKGFYFPKREPEPIADVIERWAALPADEKAAVGSANAKTARENFEWNQCAEKVEEAWELAKSRFQERR